MILPCRNYYSTDANTKGQKVQWLACIVDKWQSYSWDAGMSLLHILSPITLCDFSVKRRVLDNKGGKGKTHIPPCEAPITLQHSYVCAHTHLRAVL